MFVACEKWRKDFGVDDIIQSVLQVLRFDGFAESKCDIRNFDFKEKAQVDKYYPQYYHKMDKVSK